MPCNRRTLKTVIIAEKKKNNRKPTLAARYMEYVMIINYNIHLTILRFKITFAYKVLPCWLLVVRT